MVSSECFLCHRLSPNIGLLKGRVTLADIARESNRLIDLKPQAVATDLGEVPSQ